MKYVTHFGSIIAATFLAACNSAPTADFESWKAANPYGAVQSASPGISEVSSPISELAPNVPSSVQDVGVAPVSAAITAPNESVSLNAPSVATAGHSGFSEYSEVFVNVCLQHAPALDEVMIERSVAKETFDARNTLAGASVAVRDGQSCNLTIGGGGTRFTPPTDAEVQRLALWYAQRINGDVTQKRSAIGGSIWYEVRSGRAKYGVQATVTSGVLSYWVSKR